MKKLLCINTINNFKDTIYDPFLEPFKVENPEIDVVTITDDTLLRETREKGGVTPSILRRMYAYANCGIDMGAQCIMCTCTSVNKATELLASLMPVPMFSIEKPTAEAAVNFGAKIGVIGTVSSSPGAIGRVMQEYADSIGKKIELVPVVVTNAFEVLSSGDRGTHDKMVRQALIELSKNVDCVVFAQISMSLLPCDGIDATIFKIGLPGLEKARQILMNDV